MQTLGFELLSLHSWIQFPADAISRKLTGARRVLEFSPAFNPQKILPSQSRRLSVNTLLAVDLALRVSEGHTPDHVVFSSRFGEYNCSIELISSIHRGEETSPLKFSHSVHNTALGVYAILSGYHGTGLALSDGSSSFVSGLVSCASYLVSYPGKTVMFVYSDAGMHQRALIPRYSDWAEGVAAALILRERSVHNPDNFALEVQVEPGRVSESNQARNFLHALFATPGATSTLEGRVGANILA